MPRRPRLHVPGALYHVILRGNGRQAIFFNHLDRQRWQALLAEGIQRHGHRLHAYCWMTNHVHMAIQSHAEPLSGFLGTLASSYARATNRHMGHSGHLFERRYRAILIQRETQAMELVRYIHHNPVRAGMAASPAEHPWSSHGAYLQGNAPTWLTTDWILGLFGRTAGQARRAYACFMDRQPGKEVLRQLRRGRNDDQRILGDDDFVESVTRQDAPHLPGKSLDELVREACERHGVSETALASPSRSRFNALVRAEIGRTAIDGKAATLAEVARRFGRSSSGLCRSINRLRIAGQVRQ